MLKSQVSLLPLFPVIQRHHLISISHMFFQRCPNCFSWKSYQEQHSQSQKARPNKHFWDCKKNENQQGRYGPAKGSMEVPTPMGMHRFPL